MLRRVSIAVAAASTSYSGADVVTLWPTPRRIYASSSCCTYLFVRVRQSAMAMMVSSSYRGG
jgi:hypothetical protein